MAIRRAHTMRPYAIEAALKQSYLTRKTIETVDAAADPHAQYLSAQPWAGFADGAGRRRHHRRRHLCPDRRGGRALCRTRHHPLLRARRGRLRHCRAVLCGTCGADPGLGQHLFLRLYRARRDFRLDRRLGPGSGIRHGGGDGRGRLVWLPDQPAGKSWASPAAATDGAGRAGLFQCAGRGRRAGHHRPAHARHQGSPRASTTSWSASSWPSCWW